MFPPFNFSEVGIIVCGIFLASLGLQWTLRLSARG